MEKPGIVFLKIMRLFLSIVTGYLMFAFASALLFQLSGRDPHAAPELGFAASSVAAGIFFALFAGYWAAKCAQRPSLIASLWVAGLIAFGATMSLVLEGRSGAIWAPLAVLCLMAPSAVLGGWIYRRRLPAAG